MDNLSRRMAAAEEEFANLKEKVEFVCDSSEPPVNHDWQMRIPDKWGGKLQQQNDNSVYCFAISYSPWYQEDEVLNSYEEAEEPSPRFLVKIFILVPEHCSLYHFANFTASSEGITCVGTKSKIYLFGGGCGTSIFYKDVVGEGDNSKKKKSYKDVVAEGNNKKEKDWNLAKVCFNSEKRQPLSFSFGNKIYALETSYSLRRTLAEFNDDDNLAEFNDDDNLAEFNDDDNYWFEFNDDDNYWFEVLDTSSDDSYWLPLSNPPFPFGLCDVIGSWFTDGSVDEGHGYQIFIDASGSKEGPGGHYLFVYDVDTNTWAVFDRNLKEGVYYSPSIDLDYNPVYPWAIHSAGKDFAPFPPLMFTGDLRVLTGLKRSIPQLQQLVSEQQQLTYDYYWKGLPLPSPVHCETDRMKKVSVPCKNSSRCLTGWDLESLWSIHCLPVENMLFWQAIHLGGSSFCTLAYYVHSYCHCFQHAYLYVRVANFDITDAAAVGASSEPFFSAEYGLNKVYLVSKATDVYPLPCSKLEPV